MDHGQAAVPDTDAEAASPSADPDPHALARRQLGRAIRRARHERGETLAQIAQAADISVSLLSQVERGHVDPSLESLRSIAGALNTTPFRLLGDWSNRSAVVRAGSGKHVAIPDGGGWFEILTAWRDASFEVSRWVIEPGAATLREARGHAGEEAMFVLSGRALTQIGDEFHELEAGDFVAYDARLPHRIESLPGERLIALFVTCPPY